MRRGDSARSGRRRRVALTAASVVVAGAFAVPGSAGAKDGDLDAGFVGGIVTAAFGTSADIGTDRCSALAAGPQEKSNLNYRAGEDVANTAVVSVDADGSFCIYTDQSAHLLADLQGTYQAASGRELATFTPRRVLDTRSSGRVVAGSITRVTTNVAAGATSVLVNLTVTGAQAAGYVTSDRCSVLVAGPQEKSNVNFRAGADVANTAVVNVDADGSFCIYSDQATHLLADVQGVHVG